MKKMKLIFAIIVCTLIIGANGIVNMNKNGNVSIVNLNDLKLVATANAEDNAPNYERVWSGSCWVCYPTELMSCSISSQCCYDQEPYC